VGQTVALTATATATDSPPQNLTFNLLNAPASATLTQLNNTTPPSVAARGDQRQHHQFGHIGSFGPGLAQPECHAELYHHGQSAGVADGKSVGWSNGHFTLYVTNSILGPDYAVQESSNLVNWSTLFITNSPPMSFQWTTPMR